MRKVLRHGGRRTDRVRVVIETPDEEKARKVYEKIDLSLRQGWVKLIDPEGNVVRKFSAPTLRTRW